MAKNTLLVADDDKCRLESIKCVFLSEGYIAETSRDAIEKLQERSLTFPRQRKYPVGGQCLDMRHKTPNKRDNFFVEMTR